MGNNNLTLVFSPSVGAALSLPPCLWCSFGTFCCFSSLAYKRGNVVQSCALFLGFLCATWGQREAGLQDGDCED